MNKESLIAALQELPGNPEVMVLKSNTDEAYCISDVETDVANECIVITLYN